MRILLLHQNFVDHAHPGGTRHLELSRHLVEMGHSVTIVASNLDYLTGRRISGSREQTIDGVRILRSPAFATLHHSLVGRVISYLSFMVTATWTGLRAGKPDAVMGTSPPLFQLPSAWLIARLRRVPFILEIRDLWPKFAIDMGVLKNRFVIRLAQRAEKFFYRAAQHIIVNSPAYREYLIEQQVAAEKISIIPNGVDTTMFQTERDGQEIRRSLNLGDKFVVTYAGALGQANDLGTLLQAAHLLRDCPEIHFVIAGGGKERATLEEMARKLELHNTTFAGYFPKEQMCDVLAASNACLAILQDIPSFRTVYPNKVFDYMAAGRPTILAIDGVIRQVIGESEGGVFVPPGNAEKLADTIRELSHRPEQCRSMGNKARDYVVQHFDRKQQADFFAQLAAGGFQESVGAVITSTQVPASCPLPTDY